MLYFLYLSFGEFFGYYIIVEVCYFEFGISVCTYFGM